MTHRLPEPLRPVCPPSPPYFFVYLTYPCEGPPAVYEDIYRRRGSRFAAGNRAWRHRRFSETETEDGGTFTPGGSSGTVEVLTPTASSTGVEDN
jgi:hypothetical protein